MEKIELPILGMSCAGCALRIENTLKEIDGIEDVSVNFSLERAELILDKKISLKYVKEKIEEIGYGIVTSKVNFPVLGMTCINCAKRIEQELSKVLGVVDVNVDFAQEKLFLEYVPTLVSVKDIKRVIDNLGYELLLENKEIEDVVKEAREKELKDIKRRFLISLILAIPVFLGSMFFKFNPVFLFLLTTPIQFYGGYPFYKSAYSAIKHRFFDMNTLVSLGTTSSYIYSVLSTFFPSVFSSTNVRPEVYYDSSAIIITFVLLGRFLEKKAKSKTSQAINKLLSLKPETAFVKRGDDFVEIPVEEIFKGDIILIKPSVRIPVDGEIIDGISYIDESMLTGESLPKEKRVGDKVYEGTINMSGVIKIRAEKVGQETLLSRIIRKVEEAQNTKSSVQRLVDRIANVFVPIVLAIAFLTSVVWYIWGPSPSYKYALFSFVSVLVIACPCALGLATPTALVVGIGKGSEMGILINGAEVLEKVEKIDTVIFDKTGTLTYGKLKVKDVLSLKEYDKEKLLKIAGSLERFSEHPIAKSILEELKIQDLLDFYEVRNLREQPGYGIEGYIGEDKYFIGRIEDYLREDYKNFNLDFAISNLVGIYKNGELVGIIVLQDQLREDAKFVVERLMDKGYKVGMLTGDKKEVAEEVSKNLGLSFYISEVLPEEKAEKILELQKEGKKVAMIGDGINDAVALAQADLGIAMGNGTDIAIESGDIVLVNSDLKGVLRALELSEKIFKTIKWNLFWAFIYNVIGIPIASGLLYPFFGILLNPMFAGMAMAFSSVFVVTNSLRLGRFKTSV